MEVRLEVDSYDISRCIVVLVFAFTGRKKECSKYEHFSKQKEGVSLYFLFFCLIA